MKNLTIIAAIGKNYELGKDNKLLWRIPEDLSFFKKETINKPIIMGRKTLESLPHLLPKRKHIILSCKDIDIDGVITCHNKEELINYLNNIKEEAMVIGGASIYNLLIDDCNRMLLTEIDKEYDADVYFPRFNKEEWDKNILSTHEYEKIKYKHIEYKRK